MMRLLRILSLLTVCLALTNCAGVSALYLSNAQGEPREVDNAFWNGQPEEDGRNGAPAPTRRVAAARKGQVAASSGAALSDSQASTNSETHPSVGLRASAASRKTSGQTRSSDWFTPEWYAQEKAEADRLTKATHICRC